jgi:drug/metabolite transporter (DMT)-like permease
MTRLKADSLLVLVTIIWGTAFVAQNLAMKIVGPLIFTGARFMLGALAVLPFAIVEWRRLARRGVQFDAFDLWTGFGLGILLFLGAVFQQIGIAGTSVSNAGFLTALYVPLVPLLGWIIFAQRPHPSIAAGVLICLYGTWLLSGSELTALKSGDLWVIASTVFWAAHILFVGRVADRKGAPLLVATLQFLVCGLLGGLTGVYLEGPDMGGLLNAAGPIFYAGVLSVGVAFTLQVVAQRHTPPADAAILISAEMLVAAVAGNLILGEQLGAGQWLGGGLILTAIILIQALPLFRLSRSERISC